MERIFEYTIDSSQDGEKIGNFLRGKGYSRHILRHLKETPEGILRNGEPAFATMRLKTGDALTIVLQETESSQAIIPCPLSFDIIYEDQDLLVVNKPADMPIHPSFQNHGNTLADALTWHYSQQNISFVYRCINRLDRDTTGLVIVAKHMLSASILSHMVAQRKIHREYLAIVKGITPISGTIRVPIGRKPDSAILRQPDPQNGEPAVTHFTRLETRDGYSLVSLNLETGRTHQIRVHMGYLGYPLIGDYLYNPDYERIKRQALHSHRLSFEHPITGQPMEFTAPLPEDMVKAFFRESLP